MRRHPKLVYVNPVVRAVAIAKWKTEAVTGRIHTLVGGDSQKLVEGAGRIMFVVAMAAAIQKIGAEDPDMRILRGAVNALEEQAGNPVIEEARRASILSGLNACERLLPRLPAKELADSSLALEDKLARGHVTYGDFVALIEL